MSKAKTTFTRDFFVKKGKLGGQATAKKGRDFYSAIGKKGMESRWSKNKKET